MTPTLAMMNDYLHQRRQIDQVDAAYNFDEKTIVLEGVEIRGRKDKRNDSGSSEALFLVDGVPGDASLG